MERVDRLLWRVADLPTALRALVLRHLIDARLKGAIAGARWYSTRRSPWYAEAWSRLASDERERVSPDVLRVTRRRGGDVRRLDVVGHDPARADDEDYTVHVRECDGDPGDSLSVQLAALRIPRARAVESSRAL